MAAVFCNRFQTWSKMWHAARARSAGTLRLCAVWWTTRMWQMRTGEPACNASKSFSGLVSVHLKAVRPLSLLAHQWSQVCAPRKCCMFGALLAGRFLTW